MISLVLNVNLEGDFLSYKYLTNAVYLGRKIMQERVIEGSIVIDATIGNGNDTVFLCSLVGTHGKVYGFDIQQIAIDNTIRKLHEVAMNDRAKIIKESHSNILEHVNEMVDLITFNLGYLPGGDHHIVTKADVTLKALESSLRILKDNGLLLITVYYSHPGGIEEKEAIEEFLTNLNQKKFGVLKFDFINQVNNPPLLFVVEKNNSLK